MSDEGTTDDQALFPAAKAATTEAFSSATQLFADQLRQFSDLSAGVVPWTSTAGIPGSHLAGEFFDRLRSLVEQVPTPTAQLDTFLSELRAKRALIGALQLQLSAFEQQMELLEQSLKPLQEWGHQWSGMGRLFTEQLRPAPGGGSGGSAATRDRPADPES